MKKKILLFVAVVAFAIAGVFTVTKVEAKINPDCPNGCVAGRGGCHCFKDYPDLAEHHWKEDDVK